MTPQAKLTALVSLLMLAQPCYGLESSACLDGAKECFASVDAKRDQCFQNLASNPSCRDTEVGKLAKHRAEFSTLAPTDPDAGPSFLGPQLIDRSCIANFDNAWSAALVKGLASKESFTSLHSSLDRCSRNQASDMMRP